MAPRSMHELVNTVRSRSLPGLKSLRNRLVRNQSRQRLTVFVAGVHRSGTNMMMDILERSWETDVFNESDSRAFDDYMMRYEAVIRQLVMRSAAPVTVIKALHEAHHLRHLLDAFAPAKALWIFRSYDDAVNSALRRWPGQRNGRRNQIDAIVRDRNSAEWRGLGMTKETHEIVCKHYRLGMDDASAAALFWFFRNQLFFDQELDRDARALLVRYEGLVTDDGEYARWLSDFLGIRFTIAMRRVAHSESMGRHAAPQLDSGIRDLCERMRQSLEDAHLSQSSKVMAT